MKGLVAGPFHLLAKSMIWSSVKRMKRYDVTRPLSARVRSTLGREEGSRANVLVYLLVLSTRA
jgi:hypothetical protein